jgi:photosystem II stability/assembly factor-like uncharacterized protein
VRLLPLLAPLLLGLAPPAAAREEDDRKEAREHEEHAAALRARADWWLRQRAFPAEAIPNGAHAEALARYRDLAARRRLTFTPYTADTGGWVALGPAPMVPPPQTPNSDPVAGRMSAIAFHPSDPATMFVGAAQGGLWKTSDSGHTWTPIFDDQSSLAVGAVAIDPDAPDTIYVGTGEGTLIGYYGDGLFKSTDGGKSWIRPAGTKFAGASIHRLFLDGKSGALYLATTAGSHGRGDSCTGYYPDAPDLGLYKSTDGGSTWTRLVSGAIADFEIDVSDTPRTIFLSLVGQGAHVLVEGGAPQPLPLPAQSFVELALAPSDPSILFAGVGLGDRSGSTLYVSQDHGKSFTELTGAPNYCYSQCDYSNVLTVHPTDPTRVFVGGGVCSLWRVTNALSPQPAFRAISMPNGYCAANLGNWYEHYVHPDAHAIVLSPRNPAELWVATDGGIARSPDGGASWEGNNDGLSTMQLYGLCQDAKDPARLWGGAQDNGSMSADGSGWSGIFTGDGGPCVANLLSTGDTDPHVLVSDIFATLFDGSDVVFDAYPGFCKPGEPGCNDRSSFIAPLAGDPTSPTTVYVGTHRLWRSTDGGALGSWKPVSGDLTNGPGGELCAWPAANPDYLTAIAVAPSDGKTLYTGSAGGVIAHTSDGGATWKKTFAAPLPARWVSALAVDPADPRTVTAAYSGYSRTSPAAPGHLFRSSDGGATWQRRDLPLDVPVDSLVANPFNGKVLYAGTDVGVFVTSDAGATWTPLDGLPPVAVYTLLFHAGAASLTAATHGRGAFARHFTAAIAVDPPQIALRKPKSGPATPIALAVSNADHEGSQLHFTATPGAPWLAVTPGEGRAAGQDPVTISTTVPGIDLAPGEYDTTLTIADPGANAKVEVPVHLTVDGGGCGCAVGGRARAPLALALVLTLALTLLRSRSRSRSCSRSRKTSRVPCYIVARHARPARRRPLRLPRHRDLHLRLLAGEPRRPRRPGRPERRRKVHPAPPPRRAAPARSRAGRARPGRHGRLPPPVAGVPRRRHAVGHPHRPLRRADRDARGAPPPRVEPHRGRPRALRPPPGGVHPPRRLHAGKPCKNASFRARVHGK